MSDRGDYDRDDGRSSHGRRRSPYDDSGDSRCKFKILNKFVFIGCSSSWK